MLLTLGLFIYFSSISIDHGSMIACMMLVASTLYHNIPEDIDYDSGSRFLLLLLLLFCRQ